MRDPSRAAWLIYGTEVRRVAPRFLRSLISPAVFVVLAFVGPGTSPALAIIAIGATLALGMIAEAMQLAADREGTVLLEMSRLPLSGAELAIARLGSAATFAAAGVVVAAVVAALMPSGNVAPGAWMILRPSTILRAMPLVLLGSMVACAVAARLPLGRAIAGTVVVIVVISRLPFVQRLAQVGLPAWLEANAVAFGVPLLGAGLVAIGFAAWHVLVRALQPRRGKPPSPSHGAASVDPRTRESGLT